MTVTQRSINLPEPQEILLKFLFRFTKDNIKWANYSDSPKKL